ncbi:hypothetical protein, conserved [Plasmodium gonderi]|uniref:Uncharacterized protein n=1 Tax=Plasmodium gonderi TaxID=77519 RepID=A0A1Y1JJJ9_PLAGO|nr:hypothetical protein, conserved [Plasmodium gonderi]GAW81387.1 hypothetical protein, conserved [Plasmodium gonderi]
MKIFPISYIRNLIPSVSLNKINSTHLLKHLENVCEHISEVLSYNKGEIPKRQYCCRLLNRIEKKKKKKRKLVPINGIIETNRLFEQVYVQLDKAIVQLAEFGPSGIVRLLRAMQKIRYYDKRRKRRKRRNILKCIEYYILQSSVNDKVYNFWNYIKLNDMVLLYKMFIMNNYFSAKLLNKLMFEIIQKSDLCLSSDIIIFLCSYHIYKKKIKWMKKYRKNEITISSHCLSKLFSVIMRNNFDLTNKEMSNFVSFYSIYGSIIPLKQRVELYNKSIEYIDKTQLTYSPVHIKNFILSLFRINSFFFDKKYSTKFDELPNAHFHMNIICKRNQMLVKLFQLYNSSNTHANVEEELRILQSALRNHYYDYDSLEVILFHIKINISHLTLKNRIKFMLLILKLKNVYTNDETCRNAYISSTKMKFIHLMLDYILTECSASFVRVKYKFPPWKFRGLQLFQHLSVGIHQNGAKMEV